MHRLILAVFVVITLSRCESDRRDLPPTFSIFIDGEEYVVGADQLREVSVDRAGLTSINEYLSNPGFVLLQSDEMRDESPYYVRVFDNPSIDPDRVFEITDEDFKLLVSGGDGAVFVRTSTKPPPVNKSM